MEVIDLRPEDEDKIRQVAQILVEAFRENWPDAWPEMESALKEVRESFEEGRISLVAVDETGRVSGFIGGIPEYGGKALELHPLAVSPTDQRKGTGRLLVQALEKRAEKLGVITIYLGTDDENYMTSLGGADLYPNLWEQIANIKNLRGHPYEFYQKMGYTIVGVMPDVNGPGKPDILMAKRVKGEKG